MRLRGFSLKLKTCPFMSIRGSKLSLNGMFVRPVMECKPVVMDPHSTVLYKAGKMMEDGESRVCSSQMIMTCMNL